MLRLAIVSIDFNCDLREHSTVRNRDSCCSTFMIQGRECNLEQAAGVENIYSCGDSEHTFFWIQRSRAAWLFHSSGSKKVFHYDWTKDGFQIGIDPLPLFFTTATRSAAVD